ncbi:PDZ domain-containing protein [Ornithinibacillus contaminans]|uniref:PDZ domain-containing protein n=1 Tax=Ornithinibacillus contaminans TaxID=694055 RepID=UPI00064D9FBD|nr:PDZ domain-containing protein [Ornithinibacillus contaminans]
MVEDWLVELGKGIGRLFLNPLLYWAIALVILAGVRRVKRERNYFGTKVFDVFSEWKDTFGLSLGIGLIVSLLSLGVGMVVSYEVLLVLGIVMILVSLSLRFTMLSPSYTIGITSIILLLLPMVTEYVDFLSVQDNTNFVALTILLGLFLLVEALLLKRTRHNDTYPSLVLGERGSWIGRHFIKKFAIIPFFIFVPAGLIEPIAPYWPMLSMGEEQYGIVLFPFLIGFEHVVKGHLPQLVAKRLAKSISLLGVLVLVIAIGSVYIPWLSIVAIIIAIFGREMLNYRILMYDHGKRPYFNHTNDGLKVLSIIPGSPADRLAILIGETISKVNGQKVHSVEELYEALQQTGSFFKIELIDKNGEIRFVQSAMYEGDHHELGLIFVGDPYRAMK